MGEITDFIRIYIDDSDIRMLIFSNIGAIIYTLSPFYPLTLLRTFLKITDQMHLHLLLYHIH